jgi:CheY-like chemotaxis protein
VPSILVVDDQADARDMMQQLLSSCGFLVHTAIDGVDAITVAQRVLPSLILMDLMMPRMDGYEATRRLKADTRTRAIPVLAFSASALTNGRQLAQTAGCEDLLPKPCDLDRLVSEVRKRVSTAGCQVL